jgi:hypothetical protein
MGVLVGVNLADLALPGKAGVEDLEVGRVGILTAP